MKDILITGIPRSGTSLLTSLISKEKNILCFSEPKWLREIRDGKQSCCNEFKSRLKSKIESIRCEIRKGNPIEIMVKKGSENLLDNYYSRSENKILNLKGSLKIHVEHSSELIICVKSNTLFTSCLSSLLDVKEWQIITIVRNPVSVLMSWRSLDIPISKGLLKIGEVYSNEVIEIVKEQNLLIRQVKILNWFFKQYFLNEKQMLIKYEDVISNTIKILTNILAHKPCLHPELISHNNNTYYNQEEKVLLTNTIMKYGEYIKKYYSINDYK